MNNKDYALAKIENELDCWYGHLEYYLTEFDGDANDEMVDLCNQKIAELNLALEDI